MSYQKSPRTAPDGGYVAMVSLGVGLVRSGALVTTGDCVAGTTLGAGGALDSQTPTPSDPRTQV